MTDVCAADKSRLSSMQMENNSEDMDNIIKHVDHIRLDVAVTGGSRRHVIPI